MIIRSSPTGGNFVAAVKSFDDNIAIYGNFVRTAKNSNIECKNRDEILSGYLSGKVWCLDDDLGWRDLSLFLVLILKKDFFKTQWTSQSGFNKEFSAIIRSEFFYCEDKVPSLVNLIWPNLFHNCETV